MIVNLSAPLISSSILTCINTILKIHTPSWDHVVSITRDLVLEVPVFYSIPIGDRKLPVYPLKRHVYIIDLEKINLKDTLEILRKQYQLNPRGKFIFIGNNVTTQITETLYQFLITNVIFIDPHSGNISTYYPFKNKSLYDIDAEVIRVGKCSDSLEQLKIFDEKIPEKWDGSTVKFCTIYEPPYSLCSDCKEPGINLEIFEMVAEMLNMTQKWTFTQFPEGGDFNKYYVDVIYTNELCDIHPGLIHDFFYDFTGYYMFDDLYYYVPTAELLPRWRYVLKVLSLEIWMSWLFTILLLSFLWFLFRRIHRERNTTFMAVEVFWTNIHYFVEQYPNLPANNLSLKIIFLSMFFLSFFMNMIFKCNFNYVLSGINFEDSIDSVSDMVKNNMLFGYLFSDFSVLWTYEANGEYIDTHYIICDFSYKCFNQTAFEKNLVSLQGLRFYKYIQDHYVNSKGFPMLKLINPPIVSFGICCMLPFGHPLTAIVNKYLLYLEANGYITFILSKYDKIKVIQPPTHFDEMKLSLEHIVAPSVILFLGFLIGSIIFSMEFYHYI